MNAPPRLPGAGWAVILVAWLAAPLDAQTTTWTIDPVPRLEMGASPDDPDDQFGRVIAGSWALDGGVIVLDASPASVRHFGPDGALRRVVGREGDGPGEFRSPVALVVIGDTVVVVDVQGRRTRFGPNGSVLDEDRIDGVAACGPEWNARIDGLLSDGSVVVRCQERLFGRVRGEYRQTVGLLRIAHRGAPRDTLGWFPADSGRTDAGDVAIPRPYGPPVELLRADAGQRVFVASSDLARVHVLTFSGRALTTLAIPASPRAVTADDLDRHRESMLRAGGTANDQRVIGEWAKEMPAARRTPALKSLVAVGADELWVETWDADGRGPRWLVIDGDGRLVAEVRAPPGTEILAVGADRALGLWRDAFGVERVRVHDLRRSR